MTVVEELMAIAAALERDHVDYALVGGLAVTKVQAGAHLTVDFMPVGETLEDIWTSRQKVETEGGILWVVSRDALIRMKAQAARPQDIADIERLTDGDR